MEEVGLIDLANEEAHNLVYGQRKLLEFACTLVPEPDLVMLDEPAAGVNTTMVDQMKQQIVDRNQKGETFLVVEHNMGVVMDISHHIVVLDYGKKIAEGNSGSNTKQRTRPGGLFWQITVSFSRC